MKAGDPFHRSFDPGASPEEYSPCGVSRRTLECYLEGELLDVVDRVTVREHLADCPACREYASEYDALTRRIVSEGDPVRRAGASQLRSRSLVDCIMDRILVGERAGAGLPDRDGWVPTGWPRDSRVVGRSPVELPSRSWNRRLLRLAVAVMLLVGCWTALSWMPSPLREPRGSMALRSGDSLGTAVARSLDAGDAGLRWIVESLSRPEAVADTARSPGGAVLRLYGFRTPQTALAPARGSDARRAIEWIVEATRVSRELPHAECRFFLVRDEGHIIEASVRAPLPSAGGSPVEFVEFTPLAWSGAAREVRTIPARRDGDPQPRACYRVVMVPRAVTLPRSPLVREPAEDDRILTLLDVATPEASRWVFPASIHR